MAWNESGNGKNPWDNGRGNDGPPDLDKIVREWQKRINGILGGGKKGPPRDGTAVNGPGGPLVALLLIILAGGWAFTGLYTVDNAERGVVLRFGAYAGTTQPGLRWHIPWPIEEVLRVNVAGVNKYNQQTRMLTADENIVEVDLVVQYLKSDPVAYLFNVRDADATMSDASESAIREVIGQYKMDFVLLEGRAQIAAETKNVIQTALDEYGAGLMVTTVNLQDVNFPDQVEAAVQDAIKAREDRERLAFEAQSYANDILPKARGEAARRLLDAEGYKEQVIADAQGETSRFTQLLGEYEKAPRVTRDRLYIEAIESVYSNSNKVLLDAEGSGNLLYLPVDQMMKQGGASSDVGSGRSNSGGGGSVPMSSGTSRSTQDSRSRGSR
jgi:modulator of FtsH protease HflK